MARLDNYIPFSPKAAKPDKRRACILGKCLLSAAICAAPLSVYYGLGALGVEQSPARVVMVVLSVTAGLGLNALWM